LIGDVHAEDFILRAALRIVRERGTDLVACTGDLADGLGAVDACCDLLRASGAVVVAGNHDRWLLANQLREHDEATDPERLPPESRAYLSALPATVELETPLGRALLCHGMGDNDMSAVGPDDFGYAIESNTELQEILRDGRFRFVLTGHTHRRMVKPLGSVTVVNAGTLKRDHHPCVLLVDFAAKQVELIDLDDRGGIAGQTAVDL
jgi:predicted phosphodiesterase